MATATDIPSYLTDNDRANMLQYLDANLNSEILCALLHGIYTGILAVSVWTILINKYWTIRRTNVIIIVLLYALISINLVASWSWTRVAFIENGQNFWTINLILDGNDTATWIMDITASISTILADSYMILCCWTVWQQRWLVVLFPTFFLAAAIVSRTMGEYYIFIGNTNALPNLLFTLYLSFILATTLSSTLLIIYRIVDVVGDRRGPAGRLGVFRHFIEVLVESSALYAICVIIDLAFTIKHDFREYYLDSISGIAKGVAPTLLVGRAAVGHTLPRDDSEESTVSSLHFHAFSEPGMTSSQRGESTVRSAVLALDIEAQPTRQVIAVERETMMSTTSPADILE
ncbi:hypothetical protein F5146DRAFT_1120151 [Armillaria mellea]|nr:hypothetical protein F5146DRAFT_1120151 [Armillaria mellea]